MSEDPKLHLAVTARFRKHLGLQTAIQFGSN